MGVVRVDCTASEDMNLPFSARWRRVGTLGIVDTVMVVAGYILVAIGFIACLAGEIRMLALAYRRGFGWLLACLILAPLCWIALLMVDFKPVVKPFILAFVGLIVYWIGGSMAGIKFIK